MGWNDWWVWLPAWLGLVGGAYGAWRAGKTDRFVRGNAVSWELTAVDDVRLHIRSELRYAARQVEILVPSDLVDLCRNPAERKPVTVLPMRGLLELAVAEVYVSHSTTIKIRWRHWWRQFEEAVSLPMSDRKEFRRRLFDR